MALPTWFCGPIQSRLFSSLRCNCNSSRSAIRGASAPKSKKSCLFHFQGNPMIFSVYSSDSILHFEQFSPCNAGSLSTSYARVFGPTANVENQEEAETVNQAKLRVLNEKLVVLGIECISCAPGQYTHILCPQCKGGQSMERSLSFHINKNREFAMWRCFRVQCGWTGRVFADNRDTYYGVNHFGQVIYFKQITEESLRLEPLSDELIAYFSERMISKEILQKNLIMQISGDKNIIAFTYRRNGLLVNCKYRSMDKKFWQEKGTEKILYGLDDIKDADEIIIVEGEIDKLSLAEVGFSNCVSVPDGAPQKLSTKEVPSSDKDTRFQYLWNCMEYLDKASRIILATDGDVPGQVLAEEIARRLGKERCWRVNWPKKDEFSSFKDANEVLKNLGRGALRHIIENAELYRCRV